MKKKKLYKSSINQETAKCGELTSKAAKLSLEKLFANQKTLTPESPEAAYCCSTTDRPWMHC